VLDPVLIAIFALNAAGERQQSRFIHLKRAIFDVAPFAFEGLLSGACGLPQSIRHGRHVLRVDMPPDRLRDCIAQ
jgi:hypothetical protein